MQFTADLPALLLLGQKNLMRQASQLRVQPLRFRQQFAMALLAFPERCLHRPTPGGFDLFGALVNDFHRAAEYNVYFP